MAQNRSNFHLQPFQQPSFNMWFQEISSISQNRSPFQMQQFQPPRFNPPPSPLPSPSGFMPSMNFANTQTFSIASNDSGTKEPDTAREAFFRTLMTSLKEANKLYSGKSTSWKNPFMYKTTLCENYGSRGYCRYGVNCWYAHGIHELRCIPDSDDLPSRDFITRYLSFLGLPKNVLDEIITLAYKNAQVVTDHQWLKTSGILSFLTSKPAN